MRGFQLGPALVVTSCEGNQSPESPDFELKCKPETHNPRVEQLARLVVQYLQIGTSFHSCKSI